MSFWKSLVKVTFLCLVLMCRFAVAEGLATVSQFQNDNSNAKCGPNLSKEIPGEASCLVVPKNIFGSPTGERIEVYFINNALNTVVHINTKAATSSLWNKYSETETRLSKAQNGERKEYLNGAAAVYLFNVLPDSDMQTLVFSLNADYRKILNSKLGLADSELGVAHSEPVPTPLPNEIYFFNNWCPRKVELAELSKHLILTMNGCCIQRATVLDMTKNHPEVLAPWGGKITLQNYPNAVCEGKVMLVTPEEIEEDRLEKEKQKLALAQQEKENAVKEKFAAEARLLAAPSILKAMSENDFCSSYGRAIREEGESDLPASKDVLDDNGKVSFTVKKIVRAGSLPEDLALMPKAELITLVKKEAVRRKLNISETITRKKQFRIGSTECQLYASMGLPEQANRTIGSWGVHIQNVYRNGTVFVYTENGTVKSWQD